MITHVCRHGGSGLPRNRLIGCRFSICEDDMLPFLLKYLKIPRYAYSVQKIPWNSWEKEKIWTSARRLVLSRQQSWLLCTVCPVQLIWSCSTVCTCHVGWRPRDRNPGPGAGGSASVKQLGIYIDLLPTWRAGKKQMKGLCSELHYPISRLANCSADLAETSFGEWLHWSKCSSACLFYF
jgi:hypothetical protein